MPKRKPDENQKQPAVKKVKRIPPGERLFLPLEGTEQLYTEALHQQAKTVQKILTVNSKKLGLGGIFTSDNKNNRVLVLKTDYNAWQEKLAAAKTSEPSKTPTKLIACKDRKFFLLEETEQWYTEAGSHSANYVTHSLNKNAKKKGCGKIFTADEENNRALVTAKDYQVWKEKLSAPRTLPKKSSELISCKDHKFFLTDTGDQWYTEAGSQSAKYITGKLNDNAIKKGCGKIFTADKANNRVLVSAINYQDWNEKLSAPRRLPKKISERIACADRKFFLTDAGDQWYTEADMQSVETIKKTLNIKAKKLGCGNIFTADKSNNTVLVKTEHYHDWKAKLAALPVLGKKYIKQIACKDRQFFPIEGTDTLYTEGGVAVAGYLNASSQKMNGENIFWVEKSTNRILVSSPDYARWHQQLSAVKSSAVKIKSTARTLAKDRKFFPLEIDGSNMFYTEVETQSVQNVAKTLNNNAKKMGGEQIFVPDKKNARVVISSENYQWWQDNLLTFKTPKRPKKTGKAIACHEREFVLLEGTEQLYTDTGNQTARTVTNTLNANAEKKGLGSIFKSDKENNRVLVSKANYHAWQQITLPAKSIQFLEKSAFTPLSEIADVWIRPSNRCIDHARCLNEKALDKYNFSHKIFTANKTEKRIEVNIHDYRQWLERIVVWKPECIDLLKALNEAAPEFDPKNIHVGIAKKYLSLAAESAALPQVFQPGTGVLSLPNQLALQPIEAGEDDTLRDTYEIKNEDSVLTFYSAYGPLTPQDKVTFVFSGRKEDASYPQLTEHCRIVAVMTESEYQASHLPAHIDVLVINTLSSNNYGEYENLGAINSRRIAAMLMAYQANLSECIFMDDNIEVINSASRISNWQEFHQAIKNQLNDSVCISVRTHQARSPLFINNTIGSKIFMINVAKLKEKFSTTQDVFSLFFPAALTNFWTEDYMMQLMMVAAFGKESVHIIDDQQMTLTRMKQAQNACAKQFKKAELHLEPEIKALIENIINATSFSAEHQAWIKLSFAHLARIVQENTDYHQRRAQGIKDVNLIKQHAQANGVPYKEILSSESKSITTESIADFNLYDHQQTALEEIVKAPAGLHIVDMATGTGKTQLQIAASQLAVDSNAHPVIIVTPTQQLVQQVYEAYMLELESPQSKLSKCQVIKISGQTQDVHTNILAINKSLHDKNIVLIFCLASFLEHLKHEDKINPQLILLDECHKFTQDNINNIQSAFAPETKIIGLSATPPAGLNLLTSYSREQAVSDNIIAPFILDRMKEDYSKDLVDQKIKELASFLPKHLHPNGQALSNLKGIIYVPNIAALEEAKKNLANLPMPIYTSHSGVKNVQAQLDQFSQEAGPAIMLAVGMLRIGFSEPSVQYTIVLQAARQADDVVQIAGRVMRYQPDKIGYVLTLANANTERLETLCDQAALDRCHADYLHQSGGIQSANDMEFSPTYTPLRETRKRSKPTTPVSKKARLTHHKS